MCLDVIIQLLQHYTNPANFNECTRTSERSGKEADKRRKKAMREEVVKKPYFIIWQIQVFAHIDWVISSSSSLLSIISILFVYCGCVSLGVVIQSHLMVPSSRRFMWDMSNLRRKTNSYIESERKKHFHHQNRFESIPIVGEHCIWYICIQVKWIKTWMSETRTTISHSLSDVWMKTIVAFFFFSFLQMSGG